jgi:hypothetical protein
MATIVTGYDQTLVTTPTQPSTETVFDYDIQFPFYRDIFANKIVEEPVMQQELNSARSFFNGEELIEDSALLGNLKYGQELILPIKKNQNPFSLVQKKDLEYASNEGDECHVHVVLDCEVPCINTLPEFDELRFRFDCEYAYGVRMCDKNKDFWNVSLFTEQYALSKRAYEFVREVDFWNKVIDGLVAAPATTVDTFIAQDHPTHYWTAGTVTADARCMVPLAVQYMTDSFRDLNLKVFISKEFATELIQSVENPYNFNFENQRINTFEAFELPGFELAPRVKAILGLDRDVVVLMRSPWMAVGSSTSGGGTLTTQYPLWNSDATKQYVAILDPRVGYSFEKDGYHLNIKPYDCDKLYVGMIDTVYVGTGITFPMYGLVVEFDQFTGCVQ